MESAPHPRRGSLAPEGGHRDPREDNNSGLVAKTVSETAKRDTLQSGTAKRDCKAKLQRETAERDCKARLSKAGLQSETAERDCQARLCKARHTASETAKRSRARLPSETVQSGTASKAGLPKTCADTYIEAQCGGWVVVGWDKHEHAKWHDHGHWWYDCAVGAISCDARL